MDVALFVEGSSSPPPPRGLRALDRIWTDHLCGLLGVASFSIVVPISKKHLVAMDPENPKMSGASEPLDQLIARRIRADGFEAALVAWGLVPAWNPADRGCRWDETVRFYEMLATSVDLPELWVAYARARYAELRSRSTPGARSGPPTLQPGACIALCMDPMFEDLLVASEAAVKRALEVSGRPAGWPRWNRSPNPDRDILAPAIAALPYRSSVRRRVRGDFRTKKDDWGEYLLRKLLDDDAVRSALASHPVVLRLGEVLPTA